jgi:peptidoglycan/xylan/chitin deacetylase (PgdA/CDA1 family)
MAAPDSNTFDNRIALTFDDGPSIVHTPKVLAVLRKHRVPATFFVVGGRIRSRRARKLLREIVAAPAFLVANHSHSHPDMTKVRRARAAREIDRTNAALARAGARPSYFRFPYGQANCARAKMVRARGLTIVGWHIDSADWCFASGQGPCRRRREQHRTGFVERVRAQAHARGGGIVLLHDIHAQTAKQLELLIQTLRADGFTFTNIDDADAFPRLNE